MKIISIRNFKNVIQYNNFFEYQISANCFEHINYQLFIHFIYFVRYILSVRKSRWLYCSLHLPRVCLNALSSHVHCFLFSLFCCMYTELHICCRSVALCGKKTISFMFNWIWLFYQTPKLKSWIYFRSSDSICIVDSNSITW